MADMRLSNLMGTLEMLYFALFGLVGPDGEHFYVWQRRMYVFRHATIALGARECENIPETRVWHVHDDDTDRAHQSAHCHDVRHVSTHSGLTVTDFAYADITTQAESDTEWKFGRAMLIRQMNKRAANPAPINIFTTLFRVLVVAYRNHSQSIFIVGAFVCVSFQ
jgi:hypothetical protein